MVHKGRSTVPGQIESPDSESGDCDSDCDLLKFTCVVVCGEANL